MVAILFLGSFDNGSALYTYSRLLKIIDDFILIPGAVGCLITGLIYGVFTKWGFFRHKWIIFKWVMTIAQILFGTFVLGPWVNANVIIARELGDAALYSQIILHNLSMSKICGSIQVLLLLPYFVISIQKPWKNLKKQS